MIDFQSLSLNEIPLLRAAFASCKTRLCDATIGGTVMWRHGFQIRYGLADGILFLKSRLDNGRDAFSVPFGDLQRGLDLLESHCKETGEELCFYSVGEEEKEIICSRFPALSATSSRSWSDYLYLREGLATFAGKKLAMQRNHRNFFVKNYPDWSFEPITRENVGEVSRFFEEYCRSNQKDSPFFRHEAKAIQEVFDHLDDYGFLSGAIRADGKICAFSLGGIVGDTLFVHVEKADREIRGAYPMMVSEFVSRHGADCKYVNREEDMGDPGLRFSKEAYRPHALLTKYFIERG